MKVKTKGKKSKADRRAARLAAKKEGINPGGKFPDLIIVTRDLDLDKKPMFTAHNADKLEASVELNLDGEVIGVYKLRRVSKISVKRKIVRS